MPRQYKKKRPRVGYRSCGTMLYNDASQAAKALKLAKYLKTIVNVEFKNLTTQGTSTVLPVTPTIVQLTNIAQGDSTITRDGSNIKVLSIFWSYSVRQHATACCTLVRVMLVHDRQTNQAIYTPGDLLSDITVGDNIVSPRNLDNTSRFAVLYDKVHAYSDTGRLISFHQMYKKVQIKMRYDANVGDITDLTQSSLSLLVMSNESTNEPTITFSCRLRFVDN